MVAREEEETLHDRGSVASRSRIKRKDGVFYPFLATVPERHFCTFFFFFSFSSSIPTKSTRIRVRLRRHARQMGRLGPFEISPGEDFGGFIAHDARKCRTRGRRRGRFATKNGDRLERNREEERDATCAALDCDSHARQGAGEYDVLAVLGLVTKTHTKSSRT